MKSKTIPIVIITSCTGQEYKENWGQENKGIWLLEENEPKPHVFEELNNVNGVEEDWEEFEKKPFKIQDKEIISLVLKGNIGEQVTPHPLEILWHLLFKEKYDIRYILIHPGGVEDLDDVIEYYDQCCLGPGKEIIDLLEYEKFEFKKDCHTSRVPCIEYSFQDSIPGDWIKIISKAVRVGSLSCAVKRLKELKNLLDKCNNANFYEEVFKTSPPKRCYIYEMISWLPNLFLDLLIDSTGLWEIVDGISSPTERRAKAAELRSYLESMIKDKSTGPFRQKLADARYLAFGKTYGTGTLNCNGNKTGGSVPEKQSEYLGKNFEKENLNEMLKRPDLKDTREKLAGHLGLKPNKNNLQEDPDHSILKFLCAWDCLMEKKLKDVDDESIFPIVDFHQEYSKWYDQLVEITDRLKKQIR